MFGATNKGKDNDKSKYVYSSYGIAFDGRSEQIFGNDSARKVVVSVADLIMIIPRMIFYCSANNRQQY